MKKGFAIFCSLVLAFSVTACNGDGKSSTAVKGPSTVQQWIANEIVFTSPKTYSQPVDTVDMDVVFTNKSTGTTLTVPAFWNGGTQWIVRFALTELGDWTYQTACTDKKNKVLHGQRGTVKCSEYTGDLDIYKHGFLRTEEGKRTFVYNDGTPFFYLGDTHWTLPVEEIDGIGDIPQELADQYGIKSQFKYIMDYRAKQGYTVIQTQPLGWYTGLTGNSWFGSSMTSIYVSGVDEEMLAKFQEFDRYFDYIAEKGFVNANAQLSYPEELIESYDYITDERLEKLCRYWVARYSAYPVMWTTTQEGDNDYYEWNGCTPATNPWLKVMTAVAKYDPYNHPTTCHQENVGNTIVENSAFDKLPEHDWYAAQYTISVNSNVPQDFSMLEKYWNNPGSKPVVNYEGHYDHFWGGTYKARAQGWTAYLNGVFGYGYGVQPIWSIVWAEYGDQTPTSDDRETYERDWNWVEGLYAECGQQLIYMKDFLMQYEWEKLVPCFARSNYFEPHSTKSNYSVATIGNDVYIGYFYGNTATETKLGEFRNMKNGTYELTWLNCRTNEKTTECITVTNGTYVISGKPDTGDWALSAKYVAN